MSCMGISGSLCLCLWGHTSAALRRLSAEARAIKRVPENPAGLRIALLRRIFGERACIFMSRKPLSAVTINAISEQSL